MLIVRYPDGTGITYNDANTVYNKVDGSLQLYSDDVWIATIQASAGAIVEAVAACKVENPLKKLTGEAALNYVLENIHDLTKPYGGAVLAAKLKRKLADYSTRSQRWRVANKEGRQR